MRKFYQQFKSCSHQLYRDLSSVSRFIFCIKIYLSFKCVLLCPQYKPITYFTFMIMSNLEHCDHISAYNQHLAVIVIMYMSWKVLWLVVLELIAYSAALCRPSQPVNTTSTIIAHCGRKDTANRYTLCQRIKSRGNITEPKAVECETLEYYQQTLVMNCLGQKCTAEKQCNGRVTTTQTVVQNIKTTSNGHVVTLVCAESTERSEIQQTHATLFCGRNMSGSTVHDIPAIPRCKKSKIVRRSLCRQSLTIKFEERCMTFHPHNNNISKTQMSCRTSDEFDDCQGEKRSCSASKEQSSNKSLTLHCNNSAVSAVCPMSSYMESLASDISTLCFYCVNISKCQDKPAPPAKAVPAKPATKLQSIMPKPVLVVTVLMSLSFLACVIVVTKHYFKTNDEAPVPITEHVIDGWQVGKTLRATHSALPVDYNRFLYRSKSTSLTTVTRINRSCPALHQSAEKQLRSKHNKLIELRPTKSVR